MAAIGILLNVSRLNPAQADAGRSEAKVRIEERMRRKRAKRSVYGVAN
jgi:hypothetical protein